MVMALPWAVQGLLGLLGITGVYMMTPAGKKAAEGLANAVGDAATSLGSGPPEDDCESCDKADEIEKEGDVKQQTKGKTQHGEKDGGFSQANKDFDRIGPQNEKPISTKYGPGRTGNLPDGRSVTVRPGSSDGRPTLEIRKPNGRGSEIRYNP